MTSTLDALAVAVIPCTACGAEPGDWCVTFRPYYRTPGRRSAYLHAARTEAIRDAWREGHRDGMAAGLEGAAWSLEAARLGHVWAQRDGIPAPADDQIEEWLQERARLARERGW